MRRGLPLPFRMALSRVHRRCFAWIAFLAILLAACAPTLSQLSRSQHAVAWVQVCRAQGGTTWVALDAGGASQAGAPSGDPTPGAPTPLRGQPHLLDHCPYCSLHTDALPPMPAMPRIAQAGVATPQVPRAFLHAPHTAHPWRPAQSRAPPSLV